jgi:dienelactone hydrolase
MARGSLYFCVVSLFLFAMGTVPLAAERDLDLTAADGTRLKATYFPAAQPGPGVLLIHQCNRQRKVWDGLARQLAAAGVNVLTFDQRGFGQSGGEPLEKLSPEQRTQVETEKRPGDVDTAFQYLVAQPGVAHDRIGLGGASCGVQYSIQAARRHPEVKTLVLLSGNTDWSGRQLLRSSTNLPVFFSVADDDEFPTSILAVEWLYSLSADPEKRFAHYATGGHGADIFAKHAELQKMIVDWYVTTLVTTPGRAAVPKEAPVIPQEVGILDMMDQPGGAAKVESKLNEARQRDPKATIFSEALVNFMGYEHLLGGDTQGAVAILKLNAAAYPTSPNAYDSLADAYLAVGQKDLARQSCKRALSLLSSDTVDTEQRKNLIQASSEQKLKQLGDPPQ